jgi:hypothetical protein
VADWFGAQPVEHFVPPQLVGLAFSLLGMILGSLLPPPRPQVR